MAKSEYQEYLERLKRKAKKVHRASKKKRQHGTDKYGLHLPRDYKPKGKKRMYDMKVP